MEQRNRLEFRPLFILYLYYFYNVTNEGLQDNYFPRSLKSA